MNDPLGHDEFVRTATEDPAVVGLVLFGSRAHEGMHLEWELERFPLPQWDTAALLETVDGILATGLQRRLFADVERKARTAGLGEIIDSWGDDLDLLR